MERLSNLKNTFFLRALRVLSGESFFIVNAAQPYFFITCPTAKFRSATNRARPLPWHRPRANRPAQNLWRRIDDHLGGQRRLLLTAWQRWIEDDTRKLAEDFDISMGLHPGSYGPFDLNWIGGIDVVVDHDHLLDAATGGGAEHGEPDVLAEAFVGFIDGKHRVQRPTPAAGHMRALDTWQ